MKDQSVLSLPWRSHPVVSIDTETSGQYPIQDDLCELAAIKSLDGKVIDTYQTLVKPRAKMSDFVIGIHGITNEMVVDAPTIDQVLPDFMKFIGEGVIVGHHSPFDLGFLVYDLEKMGLKTPNQPAICSSMLARKAIVGPENHKLQTLVKFLNLQGGTAHRALDDANACLELFFECARRKSLSTFADIFNLQGQALWWQDYSLKSKILASQTWQKVIEATEKKKQLEIIYQGGSQKGKKRVILPLSVVCNPTGDFLVAEDPDEPGKTKRFYFKRLNEAEIIP
jgi:DNA polymerase III subunit epsilon